MVTMHIFSDFEPTPSWAVHTTCATMAKADHTHICTGKATNKQPPASQDNCSRGIAVWEMVTTACSLPLCNMGDTTTKPATAVPALPTVCADAAGSSAADP